MGKTVSGGSISTGRKIVRWVLRILGIVVLAVVCLFGYLTITEYKPDERESAEIVNTASDSDELLQSGESLRIVTWNIGYGALGDNADFFMDGGSSVTTADKERVASNMNGIKDGLAEISPDFVFLQEVDRDSARSYHTDEVEEISAFLGDQGVTSSTFSYNFKVKFIPYPIPPIGKVESGILTQSRYALTEAERVQLPCPFSWPIRLANLKRCLNVSRIPVMNADGTDSGKELVLVDLHLEAYDSGEGKIEQTKMLNRILQEEYDKGNYVIAGGDFNQTFSETDDSMYPDYEGNWQCGILDEDEFSDNWQFLMDNSAPTCRSLLTAYEGEDPENFQFYLIDGFIVSDNVTVEKIETKDEGFVSSDHNPVVMDFVLN